MADQDDKGQEKAVEGSEVKDATTATPKGDGAGKCQFIFLTFIFILFIITYQYLFYYNISVKCVN